MVVNGEAHRGFVQPGKLSIAQLFGAQPVSAEPQGAPSFVPQNQAERLGASIAENLERKRRYALGLVTHVIEPPRPTGGEILGLRTRTDDGIHARIGRQY